MTKAIERISPNLGPLWLRLLAVSLASLVILFLIIFTSFDIFRWSSADPWWLVLSVTLFFWLLITAFLGRIVFPKLSTGMAVFLSTITAPILSLFLLMLFIFREWCCGR
jgi:hypothetical protein